MSFWKNGNLRIGFLLPLLSVAAGAHAQTLNVIVSVQPQDSFVRAVGGERVNVSVLVPPGANHETYEPSPRQMQGFGQVKIYFRVGLPFEEAWLPKLRSTYPSLQVVDTRDRVPLLAAVAHPGETPAATGAKDPHIWLDPNRVKIQAQTIHDALAAADPALRAEFDRNLARFQEDLTRLDLELRARLHSAGRVRFMIYHPAWTYFAQAYGLEQVPIEIEGKEPGPRSLARIIDLAQAEHIKVIFVQQGFSPKSAATVAEAIHGRVLTVDALPTDYFASLRRMAELIAGAQP